MVLHLFANGQLVQPGSKLNTEFTLNRPDKHDFRALAENTSHNYEMEVPVSPAQFEDEFNRQKKLLIAALPGAAEKVILPGLLPPTLRSGADIGSHLSAHVRAVERGYGVSYPKRAFYGPGDLNKRVTLCESTGHSRFLHRPDWTVFAYVADCMRRWPVTVQRNPQPELIQAGFSVAGGYDGLSILALHPTMLASGYSCPGIDYSGVQVDNGGGSLCSRADDGGLLLGVCEDVSDYLDDYSGALSFLG